MITATYKPFHVCATKRDWSLRIAVEKTYSLPFEMNRFHGMLLLVPNALSFLNRPVDSSDCSLCFHLQLSVHS